MRPLNVTRDMQAPGDPSHHIDRAKGECEINVKAMFAAGDGITDDTAAFARAVALALNSGVKSVKVPKGIYLIDGLTINGDILIEGEGDESVIKRPAPATDNAIAFTATAPAGHRVEIRDLKFDGNKAARLTAAEAEGPRADLATLTATVDLTVINCTFTDTLWDGIRAHGPLRVEGCRFRDGALHQGDPGEITHYIYCVPDADDLPAQSAVVIRGNSFIGTNLTDPDTYHSNPSGIFLTLGEDGDENDQYYENVIIADNFFNGCGTNDGGGNVTGAIDTYNGCEKIVIANNVIRRHSYCGIKAQAVDKAIISGNVLSDGHSGGDAAVPDTYYGIIVEEKPRGGVTDERYDVVIQGNVINGASLAGIQAYADNLVIANNLIRDVEMGGLANGCGIIAWGENVAIVGNLLQECEQRVIMLGAATGYLVANNLIDVTTYANSTGVHFTGADQVQIVNNVFRMNAGSAIRTTGTSDTAHIAGNFIDGANYGLDIRETSGANTGIVIGQNEYWNSVTADINHAYTSGVDFRDDRALTYEAGRNSASRGSLTLWDGAGGNTPAFILMHSPNGTGWYLFVEDDGSVKVHNAVPTANADGTVVGTQT